MKIRMYNVGFGDCFCLRDRRGSLLVDFGSRNKCIGGRPRHEVLDKVISDLSTISGKNLLLTHFHLDHLSGLLYMMKHKGDANEFGEIYLPDVFSSPQMSPTLVLLLLADLMKDSVLPGGQVSLLSLVEALCQKPFKVTLLSRGETFERGKYQALWPAPEVIRRDTDQVWESLLEGHEEILRRLEEFAEKLRQVVWAMTPAGSELRQPFPPAGELGREFRRLRDEPAMQQLLGDLEEKKIPLRQFGNKISIVFQNARDGELNLLFTGDVQPEHLRMIADDFDKKAELYDHYWCIKVPHHGTQRHYYDFSRFTPENMLISNGIYYADSKKRAKACRISENYSGLFYIEGAFMYCSDCRCCNGYANGCTCKEKSIIAPDFYIDI